MLITDLHNHNSQKLYHQQQLQNCRQNCGIPEEYNPLVARATAQQSQDRSQVPFVGDGGNHGALCGLQVLNLSANLLMISKAITTASKN